MTRFTPEYLQFREKLDNHYLVSLKLKLMEMNAQGLFKENTLTIVKIGAELVCHVYVIKEMARFGFWEAIG